MLIEIRNTHYRNQGAQLMLRAAVERLGTAHRLVVSDRCARPETRAELGLERLVWVQGLKRGASRVEQALPNWAWRSLGRVPSRCVDAVLDASGFAYGDAWGPKNAAVALSYARRLKQRNQKLIFLPQAFGPFEQEPLREIAAELFGIADVIFARDVTSYEHVTALCPHDKVKLSNDFTIPLAAMEYCEPLPAAPAAFIPNTKMLQKGGGSRCYLPLLVECARLVQESGMHPVVVCHATDDKRLSRQLSEAFSPALPLVSESNPLRLKGLLARCQLVFSSRFHGLVSSLSKGVPSVATSWSHKYAHLLAEFDCGQGLLSVDLPLSALPGRLEPFLRPQDRQELQSRITRACAQLSANTRSMWHEVEACLNDAPHS